VPKRLIGREPEIAASECFLDAVALGPAALLLHGDAGIGKTTIWQEIRRLAERRRYTVLSCRPAAAESKLPFAALTDLLAGVEDEILESLPDPQRLALDVACLRAGATGPAPDQRAVFTGFLSALVNLASATPVLVAVDDAQWLDVPTGRALAFAARRLDGRRIGLLAAVRLGAAPVFEESLRNERVDRIELGPLSLGALYRLVSERIELALPRPVLLRIEAVSGGNPMFALEIARVLERNGLPAAPSEPLPVPESLAELVSKKIERLPRRTREAILVAAALSRPTTDMVDGAALEPATAADIVSIRDGAIEFTHPLFPAAAYAAASPARRRDLHAQLARRVREVEERARHLMLASSEPAEPVAAALHEAAEHAAARGAPEVAAELEEEAARRTLSGASGRTRLLRAAAHYIQAGDGARARALAEEVLAAGPSPTARADALQVLAETCYRDRLPDALGLLSEALSLVADDPARTAELELSLAFVALATGDAGGVALHARRSAELAEQLGDTAALAEALAMSGVASFFMAQGFDEATLERALSLEDPERRVPLQLRPSMNAAQLFEWICRFDRAEPLYAELRDRIVARGEESDLPFVLVHLAACRIFVGDLATAEAYANEALDVADLVESEVMRGFALVVRAIARVRRGDVDAARADALEALAICERVGWPHGIFAAHWTLGCVALCEGDHRLAAEVMEPVIDAIESLDVYDRLTAMYLPDAIEALIATGQLERAERLIDAIAECGRRLDRPWALAEAARCRALADATRGDVEAALVAVDQALVHHDRLTMPFERGRTLIVKGILERRVKRKRAARDALEQAVVVLAEMDAGRWAAAARRELERVGIRRHTPDGLTETERRVAELAASGLRNREIAAEVFLTPKSVEDVLARVYRKLEIHSRAELGARMAVTAARL
jgi:DNA-binding CsgD family transcriptional regulator